MNITYSVFVSGPINPKANLPVILFIHGGGSVHIHYPHTNHIAYLDIVTSVEARMVPVETIS